jgi:hypothetical protein
MLSPAECHQNAAELRKRGLTAKLPLVRNQLAQMARPYEVLAREHELLADQMGRLRKARCQRMVSWSISLNQLRSGGALSARESH